MRTLLSQIVFRPSGEVPPVLPSDAALARRLSFKVRTSVIDNPQDSGRLWLSLDNPTHIRIIEVPAGFRLPPSAQANANVDPSSVIPQKALRDVLVEVLREEAKILLPQKLAYFAEQYGFKFGKVTVKHNSSNWGSCSRAGNINLNLNLIRLPEPLCDYVLLHELCHLKEPNHGPRFHALLERLCLSNIRHLIDLGSPDAMKYRAWIDNLDASDSSAASTSPSFFRLFKPSSSRPTMTPLNEVLSREISKWRLL